MTNQEYESLSKQNSPKSPMVKNMILAFLVGGAICTIGEGLSNAYQHFGLSVEDAASAVSITMIFLGAFFTGLKVYDSLARYAGAGTLVPITGFANSIVAPAMEFKSEGFVLGLSVKMFSIAGPVLVFGINASIIYGLILWIFRLKNV